MKFASLIFAAASLVGNASAFSTGAGGCAPDEPAVQGLHLRDGATTGSLSDGGVTFAIGDIAMSAGGTVTVGSDDSVSLVTTAADLPIRGILMRVSGADDLEGVLTGDDAALLQDAQACASFGSAVAALTHTSPVDKTEIAMTLDLAGTTATSLTIDLTVVMDNTGSSIYYYDQFTLTAEEPAGVDSTPTDVPVDNGPAPTEAPAADPPMPTPTGGGYGTGGGGSGATTVQMMVGATAAIVATASFLLM